MQYKKVPFPASSAEVFICIIDSRSGTINSMNQRAAKCNVRPIAPNEALHARQSVQGNSRIRAGVAVPGAVGVFLDCCRNVTSQNAPFFPTGVA